MGIRGWLLGSQNVQINAGNVGKVEVNTSRKKPSLPPLNLSLDDLPRTEKGKIIDAAFRSREERQKRWQRRPSRKTRRELIIALQAGMVALLELHGKQVMPLLHDTYLLQRRAILSFTSTEPALRKLPWGEISVDLMGKPVKLGSIRKLTLQIDPEPELEQIRP
ncbi:MAG TPA: hypothetical protein DCR93_22795 [Cytophagales bacterium]|nr:hypothetical protein [Cytophagales bacterium]HAP62204.1 hypothetical protein [Cytophagales bacterium]